MAMRRRRDPGTDLLPAACCLLPALTARFSDLRGMVVSEDACVLYILDPKNRRTRKLRDGVVSTLHWTGEEGIQDGAYRHYLRIALDSEGRLLVADCAHHQIRVGAMDGATTTLAGTGGYAGQDGPAATASSRSPRGVLAAPDGPIYVEEYHSIRKISTDGIVSTIAGSGVCGFDGGPGNSAVSVALMAWPSQRPARSSSAIC